MSDELGGRGTLPPDLAFAAMSKPGLSLWKATDETAEKDEREEVRQVREANLGPRDPLA